MTHNPTGTTSLHTKTEYDDKGRRIPKRRIFVQDQWIQCNSCLETILWDDAHDDKRNFGSGKRANCKDCQYAKRKRLPVQSRYAQEKLVEDQVLYGGIAFTYLLFFEDDNVIHVYIGMTTQSPRLRFAQHMGGTHVPELAKQLSKMLSTAADEVLALSESQEQLDILHLSGISQSIAPEILKVGWGDSIRVHNLPSIHVVAHPSTEAAATAERAEYDRLSKESRLRGKKCIVLNRTRPSGKSRT